MHLNLNYSDCMSKTRKIKTCPSAVFLTVHIFVYDLYVSRWGTHNVYKYGTIYELYPGYHGNRAEGEEESQRGEATGSKRGAARIITCARSRHAGGRLMLK